MRLSSVAYLFILFSLLLLSGCEEDCPDGCPILLPTPDTNTSLSVTVTHAVRGTDRYEISGANRGSEIRELPFGFTRNGTVSSVGNIGNFYFNWDSPFSFEECNQLSPFYWSQNLTTDFYLQPNERTALLEFTSIDSNSPDCYPSREELIAHFETGIFPIGQEPGEVSLFLAGRYVGFQNGEPGSYFTNLAVPQQTGVLTITDIDTESARYSRTNGIFINFTIDRVNVLDHMWYDPEPYTLTDITGRIFIPTE